MHAQSCRAPTNQNCDGNLEDYIRERHAGLSMKVRYQILAELADGMAALEACNWTHSRLMVGCGWAYMLLYLHASVHACCNAGMFCGCMLQCLVFAVAARCGA